MVAVAQSESSMKGIELIIRRQVLIFFGSVAGIFAASLGMFLLPSFDLEARSFLVWYLSRVEAVKVAVFILLSSPLVAKGIVCRKLFIYGAAFGVLYPVTFFIASWIASLGIAGVLQFKQLISEVSSFVLQFLFAMVLTTLIGRREMR